MLGKDTMQICFGLLGKISEGPDGEGSHRKIRTTLSPPNS